jgi:hypothetical protein
MEINYSSSLINLTEAKLPSSSEAGGVRFRDAMIVALLHGGADVIVVVGGEDVTPRPLLLRLNAAVSP